MTTTEINYKGTDYTCRIVTSNEGESLIIGGLELLDALMQKEIETWAEKGYKPIKAKVRFIVAWKAKDAPKEEQKIAVVLADLLLKKSE